MERQRLHPSPIGRLTNWAALMVALLVFAPALHAEAELGIGLVDVEFDDKTIIHLYESAGAKSSGETIRFFDDTSKNSWNIKDLESVRRWLAPESLWLDYHSFVFRCRARRPGRLQVIVNNYTGKKLVG